MLQGSEPLVVVPMLGERPRSWAQGSSVVQGGRTGENCVDTQWSRVPEEDSIKTSGTVNLGLNHCVWWEEEVQAWPIRAWGQSESRETMEAGAALFPVNIFIGQSKYSVISHLLVSLSDYQIFEFLQHFTLLSFLSSYVFVLVV